MNTSADLCGACGGGQLGIGQIIGQLLENGIADSAQLSIVVPGGHYFLLSQAHGAHMHMLHLVLAESGVCRHALY